MKQIAEQKINPTLLKRVAPDVVDKSGQQRLMAKTIEAHKMKDMLDKALSLAANAIGGTFSSRVKDLDTASKKVAQKRLQGRDYSIDDLHDLLGGCLIVNSPKDYNDGEEQIKQMAKAGIFKIQKQENVKTGNYEARHYDVLLPNGTKGEIQLHTKNSEAESLANHQIRAEFGEEPKGIVKALRDKQADIIEDLHPDRAKALSNAITTHIKQNEGTIPHDLISKLVKQASI